MKIGVAPTCRKHCLPSGFCYSGQSRANIQIDFGRPICQARQTPKPIPMKNHLKLGLLAGISALALSAAAQPSDIIVNNFDTADEAAGWSRWWGAASQGYEFDATVDAAGNANSGSLKATIGFNQPAYTGDNQFAVIHPLTPMNGSDYTNLVFDLRWDPSSPTRPYNDHGYLECGFRVNGFEQSWFPGGTAIPTNGEWIHFELPIQPTMPNLGTVAGIVLKMWAGGAGEFSECRRRGGNDVVAARTAAGPGRD